MCVKLFELPPRSGLSFSIGAREGLEKVFTHGFGGSAWVDRSFLTTKSGYFVEVLVKLFGECVVAHVHIY